jgi:predicted transposase YdaD
MTRFKGRERNYTQDRVLCATIKAMLHLPDVDPKQTGFYQEAFTEGHPVGHQERRQEGARRMVGNREAALTLLLRLLRRRLGPRVPAQETRIQALPVTDLEALDEVLVQYDFVITN